MKRLVSVIFNEDGKAYEYRTDMDALKEGDLVVVESLSGDEVVAKVKTVEFLLESQDDEVTSTDVDMVDLKDIIRMYDPEKDENPFK